MGRVKKEPVVVDTENAGVDFSGKVKKLIVQNFRSIGKNPVSIDLDKIVVLVGPNNCGKSSILRAYEIVMSDGSKAGNLDIKDFPNGVQDPENPVIIELHTQPSAKLPPANKWISLDEDGVPIVKERWVWPILGKAKRQGWNVENNAWDESFPWGPANIAKAMRPQPYSVKAFDTPEDQATEITKLISTMISDKAKAIPCETGELDDQGNPKTEFDLLKEQLKNFYAKALDQSQGDIVNIETKITDIITEVFADHIVKYTLGSHDDDIKLFSKGGSITVGRKDGYRGPLESQGSGARRTILWAVLKVLSEEQKKDTERPKVLLIDEPELCLHPNAVRDACRVLYDLADKVGWQVIVTTHSPVFIDLSRDNTTVVRVERSHSGQVTGTTLFKPEKIQLGPDDKENLKLLNAYDPYVSEFFFGGKIIVVEGDTEYAAFKQVLNSAFEGKIAGVKTEDLKNLRDVHIIRARGKYNIISICKILNQFGAPYSILHDSDYPKIKTKKGSEKVNGAWVANQSIADIVSKAPSPDKVRVFASLNNFEYAFLGKEVGSDKPYNAVKEITKSEKKLASIYALLLALTDPTKDFPKGAVISSSLKDDIFVTPTEGDIKDSIFKFDNE